MLELEVEFNGISNIALDLHCISCGRRQRAEERIEEYSIPNSDYEPTEHTGKYKPYLRPMKFAWKDKARTAEINTWLKGYAKLRTSKDPSGYFKANVVSGYDVNKFSKRYDDFQVQFKINPPFFYMDSGDEAITLTAPGTIVNMGTHIAEPYIKITGSGNIDLTINSTVYSFTGVDTYIEIDSESKYIYRDTLNQGDKMVGKFPILELGENAISWTGTVTKIEITPRWREL